MPSKLFDVPGIGAVKVTKRSGSRSLRLSIASSGEVRVSIPGWSPYQAGLDFARSRADWIVQNAPPRATLLQDGHRIGKAHRLRFAAAAIDTPSSRLSDHEIKVSRPSGMAITHPEVQKVARRAGIRALRSQAEAQLPGRLRQLANEYGFSYSSVQIKMLKGRWGSCDAHQNIVLNLFLMQLPWQLIDYVLIHELVHTKHLNHGEGFWREFLRHEPRAKGLRSIIKKHQPVLEPVPPTAANTPSVA